MAYYIFVTIEATAHAALFFTLSSMPQKSPFFYDSADKENARIYIDIMELIGSYGCKIVNWIVITIAYQLTIALRVLLKT